MTSIKFHTLGCKVNQYDTQDIREQFVSAGFIEAQNNHPADIYCINTCTVTERADRDSLYIIRRLRKENPQAKIIVTGCLAELDEDKIRKSASVDFIVKNKDKENLANIFLQGDLASQRDNEITSQRDNEITKNGISYFKGHTRAFLKIQDGCNNFCSYCKVPLVRGASYSRAKNTIIDEARQLVENGYKEIVLTGVCLGAYGQDLKTKSNLIEIIEALEKIDGLLRIRLSSIEVAYVSDELIAKIFASGKLCRHLHIPLQSGDDKILKRMNRHYKAIGYLKLIEKIRKKIASLSITTDVLVGFPGEGEENFQNTLNLIKEILPLKTHIFTYSKRAGTAAAENFHQGLSQKVIQARAKALKDIANGCSFKYKQQFLQQTQGVLIEGRSKHSLDFWQGYTENYIQVLVESGLNLKNELRFIKLDKIINGCVVGHLK